MKRTVTLAFTFVIIIGTFSACAEKSETDKAVSDILRYCNEARADEGLAELSLNDELSQNAAVRAQEISREGNFKHVRPDGSGCFTVITVHYVKAGENLAKGKPDGKEIVNAWLNSEEHRRNILDGAFSQAGIASFEKDGEHYWVMLFTG